MEFEVWFEIRSTRFLVEINKLMDGIHIEEMEEDSLSHFARFEAKLSSIYVDACYWSPTDAFKDAIHTASMKFFGMKMTGFNNTGTVFWIDKGEIK